MVFETKVHKLKVSQNQQALNNKSKSPPPHTTLIRRPWPHDLNGQRGMEIKEVTPSL